MKAIVYSGPGEFELRDVEVPECGEKQVLIRVRACGICKTDLHIHSGSFISRFPLTPGHEFAGTVERVGKEVARFSAGDRVVADNTVLCGECFYCRKNQPLYCENFYSLGVNGPGGFAEYVVVNEDKVFAIGDHLSFSEAAFTEPAACVVHGLDLIEMRAGEDVLIFGAGPTGLILAQLVKYNGAGNLIVAAPTPSKLRLAERLGADRTVQVDKSDYSRHREILKRDYPRGFDVIIDATGVAGIVEQCFDYTRMGARVVVYGVCDEDDRIEVSPYEIFSRELKLIGSFAQTHCFDRALKYLENRTLCVDELITETIGLEEFERGLELVGQGGENIKVVVSP